MDNFITLCVIDETIPFNILFLSLVSIPLTFEVGKHSIFLDHSINLEGFFIIRNISQIPPESLNIAIIPYYQAKFTTIFFRIRNEFLSVDNKNPEKFYSA